MMGVQGGSESYLRGGNLSQGGKLSQGGYAGRESPIDGVGVGARLLFFWGGARRLLAAVGASLLELRLAHAHDVVHEPGGPAPPPPPRARCGEHESRGRFGDRHAPARHVEGRTIARTYPSRLQRPRLNRNKIQSAGLGKPWALDEEFREVLGRELH